MHPVGAGYRRHFEAVREYARPMKTVLEYGVPMVALVAATTAWFPLRRRFADRKPRSARVQVALEVVCALPLVASGTLHLVQPQAFTNLLSPAIPQRTLIIVLTGIPEWAGAIGLFVPRTRRAASVWLAVLMIAIFPANIYVAGQNIHGMQMPSVPVRWAMQAVYIWLLLFTGDKKQQASD